MDIFSVQYIAFVEVIAYGLEIYSDILMISQTVDLG
jgi:hypothetical protein